MNPKLKFILTGVLAFIAGGALVFFIVHHGKGGGESDEGATTNAVQVKHGPAGEAIVVLDAETQKRVGLAITNPMATQRQPEVKAFGHVIDPATFASAIGELESARTAAEASGKEYDRLKTLAGQNNVSARDLETARATTTHDQLASEAARGKFILTWGKRIADDPAGTLKALADDELVLVQAELPAGQVAGKPAGARVLSVNDAKAVEREEFFDAGAGIDPQTQMQSFLFKGTGHALKPGAAVDVFIALDGTPADGVEIPAEAVLRHQGRAWIYEQTAENEFTRREVADPDVAGDWFSHDLTATNRIVVTGAQTILSAELSSGGFNTGERD